MRRLHLAIAALVVAVAGLAGLTALGWVSLPSMQRVALGSVIGGPFELTSHDGARFRDTDLKGKPFAIFFGFTQCPDVCPTTLLEMSQHLEKLGGDADKLRVVFVSVDPERDTPAHLKAYLASFDTRIIGLSGTVEEVQAIARSYRVFYQKVPTSSGYTLNHTASVYLMDAAGRFTGTLSFQEPQATQMEKLRRLVGATS